MLTYWVRAGNKTCPPSAFFFIFIVFFSNLYSSNLAGDGLWQFIDEFDDARIFIRSSLMLHMILQLLDEVRARHTLVFILQYDGCLDYHTADWVPEHR